MKVKTEPNRPQSFVQPIVPTRTQDAVQDPEVKCGFCQEPADVAKFGNNKIHRCSNWKCFRYLNPIPNIIEGGV